MGASVSDLGDEIVDGGPVDARLTVWPSSAGMRGEQAPVDAVDLRVGRRWPKSSRGRRHRAGRVGVEPVVRRVAERHDRVQLGRAAYQWGDAGAARRSRPPARLAVKVANQRLLPAERRRQRASDQATTPRTSPAHVGVNERLEFVPSRGPGGPEASRTVRLAAGRSPSPVRRRTSVRAPPGPLRTGGVTGAVDAHPGPRDQEFWVVASESRVTRTVWVSPPRS